MTSHKTPSFRPALAQARGLGSARSGTHHWWMLRLTSLALIPLAFYPLVMLVVHAVYGGYDSVLAWVKTPYAAGAVILFLGVSFHHAANGLQTVVEDYVHCACVKTILLIGIKFAAVALVVIGSLAVLKIMFGA